MTDEERKELKTAGAEFAAAERAYEAKWPDANWPCLHPMHLLNTKVIKALTALIRKAIERGSPVTEEESNKAQDLSPESWLW